MAGPSLGESEKQIMQAAEGVAKAGRENAAAGGASSRGLRPTIFKELEEEGMKLLGRPKGDGAGDHYGSDERS